MSSSGTTVLSCFMCTRNFFTIKSYRDHARIDHSVRSARSSLDGYKCPYTNCGLLFSSFAKLSAHGLVAHRADVENGEGPIHCTECESCIFSNQTSYEAHKRKKHMSEEDEFVAKKRRKEEEEQQVIAVVTRMIERDDMLGTIETRKCIGGGGRGFWSGEEFSLHQKFGGVCFEEDGKCGGGGGAFYSASSLSMSPVVSLASVTPMDSFSRGWSLGSLKEGGRGGGL